MAPKGRKRRVLIHANCQGQWIMNQLVRRQVFTEEFDFVYLANFGETPADHPIHDADFLKQCDFVCWQTAAGVKPPAYLEQLPGSCRQFRFPTLWLKFLWPLHATDPRSKPEPGFPFGRFAYGDRLILRMLEQGIPIDEIPQRYLETDVRKLVNLDRSAEMAFAELRLNDRQSDFAVAPVIEREFRATRLFGTLNHSTHGMLYRVQHAIEAFLLDRPALQTQPLPPDASDVMGDIEIPIHPFVAQHFQLTWVAPNAKWRYHSRLLTQEEYVRAFAAFEAIPKGDDPQLTLDQAQYAVAQGKVQLAERLLLDGAARYPALPHFLLVLAAVLLRSRRSGAAENVLRHAVTRFPTCPEAQIELGHLLARNNRRDDALAAYQKALALNAANIDAQRGIERLTHSFRSVVAISPVAKHPAVA